MRKTIVELQSDISILRQHRRMIKNKLERREIDANIARLKMEVYRLRNHVENRL